MTILHVAMLTAVALPVAVVVGEVAATVWFERVYLPRICGED